MSPIRIFVMYPAAHSRTWHVSIDGKEGTSYSDGSTALTAACDKARAMEGMGMEVQVRQEGADGAWQIVRE
jgi:hypothetical protein